MAAQPDADTVSRHILFDEDGEAIDSAPDLSPDPVDDDDDEQDVETVRVRAKSKRRTRPTLDSISKKGPGSSAKIPRYPPFLNPCEKLY